MFIERLINQTNAPLVEQVVRFAAARHRLISENIANVDTPGFRQTDLAADKFYELLRNRAAQRQASGPGEISFDDIGLEVEHPSRGILFHDLNNRSMEQLMSEQAKNGLMYTMAIEILRKQFGQLEMALKERIG